MALDAASGDRQDPAKVEQGEGSARSLAGAEKSKPAPGGPAKNQRSFWRVLAIGVVLALLLLAWLLRNVVFGTPVDTYAVHVGNLRQTVVASGRIITPQRVAIAARSAGRVRSVAVAEGASVQREQVLVALDDSDERANVAQALAALAQANARLSALREVELHAAEQSLRETDANVRQAGKQLARNRELQARGFVAQAALDAAQRDLDVAQSQRGSANLQVLARQPNGSATALAEAAVAQATAALSFAQLKLAQQLIVAPAAGILISRAVEPGDVVLIGQVLMDLAGAGQTEIEVQLDEKNLRKLALGQKALASADAYANERFAAEVAFINPAVDASRGAVLIKLRVPEPPPYLRQDMTVSVDIDTARAVDALVVPSGAIRDIDKSNAWVLVVRDRRAVRQAVEIGLLGDENTQVLSGLAVGEALIPTSALVLEGAKVRARPVAEAP